MTLLDDTSNLTQDASRVANTYFAVRAGAVAVVRRPGAAGAAAALLLVTAGRPAAAARRALAVRWILNPNILGT